MSSRISADKSHATFSEIFDMQVGIFCYEELGLKVEIFGTNENKMYSVDLNILNAIVHVCRFGLPLCGGKR